MNDPPKESGPADASIARVVFHPCDQSGCGLECVVDHASAVSRYGLLLCACNDHRDTPAPPGEWPA